MKELVLMNDGQNFETICYNTIDMFDPSSAVKLIKKYPGREVSPSYWRDQMHALNISENLFISAIVMYLGMPFSAYVLEEETNERIVIAPWLYSSKLNREEFLQQLFGEEATAETLASFSRTLALTAEYMTWLTHYYRKHPLPVTD